MRQSKWNAVLQANGCRPVNAPGRSWREPKAIRWCRVCLNADSRSSRVPRIDPFRAPDTQLKICLMFLGRVEASTGIEPVYTDLQSAASPLRQLAAQVDEIGYPIIALCARPGAQLLCAHLRCSPLIYM